MILLLLSMVITVACTTVTTDVAPTLSTKPYPLPSTAILCKDFSRLLSDDFIEEDCNFLNQTVEIKEYADDRLNFTYNLANIKYIYGRLIIKGLRKRTLFTYLMNLEMVVNIADSTTSNEPAILIEDNSELIGVALPSLTMVVCRGPINFIVRNNSKLVIVDEEHWKHASEQKFEAENNAAASGGLECEFDYFDYFGLVFVSALGLLGFAFLIPLAYFQWRHKRDLKKLGDRYYIVFDKGSKDRIKASDTNTTDTLSEGNTLREAPGVAPGAPKTPGAAPSAPGTPVVAPGADSASAEKGSNEKPAEDKKSKSKSQE